MQRAEDFHRVWSTVVAKPVGATFTVPQLREEVGGIIHKRVSAMVYNLKSKGVLSAVNPGRPGDFSTATTWRVVDNSKKPKVTASEKTSLTKETVVKQEKVLSQKPDIIKTIRSLLSTLEKTQGQSGSLEDFSTNELLDEIGHRAARG